MRIVALEGPSYAGKTTAIATITRDRARTAVFDCYVRELRPGPIPEPRTRSRAEQIEAFTTFMQVEACRVERAEQLTETTDVLVLDRSVDTLLAHAHALDVLYGLGAMAEAAALLPDLPHLVPDLTIYLDPAPITVRSRRAATGARPDYFLHDPAFLVAWRGYFLGRGQYVTRQIQRVNANVTADELAEQIGKLL